ncbi:flavin monoamine oxidase family protein [Aeromicrobium sp. JJY06]|uniref:flavin monoamine oxidase family protein n=1 Tax=Aeromicrobium sp. JJY06 TaxID=3373478 RepID=UPI00376EA7AF
MKVIVVGAGLAGLAAAHRLVQAGEEVQVLEAGDRVGGRCRSTTLANGVTVERGGEFIDPEQHVIRRFCAELGLPLIPHAVNFFRRRQPDGTTPSIEELHTTMTRLSRAAQQLDEDVSVRTLFHDVFGSQPHAILDRIETSCAGDAGALSARAVLSSFEPPQIDHASRVLGGNDRIARELARTLADRVRLGTPVEAVSDSDGHVVVTTADGSESAADALVLALPLPLLHRLQWDSGLPHEWATGAAQLGFGDAAKLSVAVAEPAAPQAVAGPGRRWWSWNSASPADRSLGSAGVSCFAGTAEQVTELGAVHGADDWLSTLVASRHDLALDPADHVVTAWRSEPWARGAYSFAKVGWDPAAAQALQRRVGRVVLAGEHTAGPLASTMNGALASGERAARVVRAAA